MINELKPCPFCGGEAELIEHTYGAYKDATVACKQCGIRSTLFSNDLEAVMFWNRRAESKSGRWVCNEKFSEYICSECGEEAPNDGYDCGANYCPNCGAKMD